MAIQRNLRYGSHRQAPTQLIAAVPSSHGEIPFLEWPTIAQIKIAGINFQAHGIVIRMRKPDAKISDNMCLRIVKSKLGFGLANHRRYAGNICRGNPLMIIRSEEHTSELQSLRHLVC